MNGLAEASTNGNTIYAYRCRGEVLYTSRSGLVPANTKFLPVMALATAGSTNEEWAIPHQGKPTPNEELAIPDSRKPNPNQEQAISALGIRLGECGIKVSKREQDCCIPVPLISTTLKPPFDAGGLNKRKNRLKCNFSQKTFAKR